jgi:hypothetical protein
VCECRGARVGRPLICKPSPEITSSSRLSRSYCLLLFLIAVCVQKFGAPSLMEIDFVAEPKSYNTSYSARASSLAAK